MRRNAIRTLRRELQQAAARQARPGRRSTRRVVPLAAVLVVAVSGAAVAAVGGSVLGYAPDSPDDPVRHAPMQTAAPGQIRPLSRSDLANMRRERRRRAPIRDAHRWFAALTVRSTGDYRTIYRDAKGLIAARASNREICIRYRQSQRGGGSGSCAPTNVARTYGVYVVEECIRNAPHPQRRRIAGIAPDGVDAVRVERKNVEQAAARVRNNGFILITDEPIDTIIIGRARRTMSPISC